MSCRRSVLNQRCTAAGRRYVFTIAAGRFEYNDAEHVDVVHSHRPGGGGEHLPEAWRCVLDALSAGASDAEVEAIVDRVAATVFEDPEEVASYADATWALVHQLVVLDAEDRLVAFLTEGVTEEAWTELYDFLDSLWEALIRARPAPENEAAWMVRCQPAGPEPELMRLGGYSALHLAELMQRMGLGLYAPPAPPPQATPQRVPLTLVSTGLRDIPLLTSAPSAPPFALAG